MNQRTKYFFENVRKERIEKNNRRISRAKKDFQFFTESEYDSCLPIKGFSRYRISDTLRVYSRVDDIIREVCAGKDSIRLIKDGYTSHDNKGRFETTKNRLYECAIRGISPMDESLRHKRFFGDSGIFNKSNYELDKIFRDTYIDFIKVSEDGVFLVFGLVKHPDKYGYLKFERNRTKYSFSSWKLYASAFHEVIFQSHPHAIPANGDALDFRKDNVALFTNIEWKNRINKINSDSKKDTYLTVLERSNYLIRWHSIFNNYIKTGDLLGVSDFIRNDCYNEALRVCKSLGAGSRSVYLVGDTLSYMYELIVRNRIILDPFKLLRKHIRELFYSKHDKLQKYYLAVDTIELPEFSLDVSGLLQKYSKM